VADGTCTTWALDTPETIAPRPGEELDAAVVAAYLRPRLPHTEEALTIRQFTGGYANLTYLLRFGTHEYVLRRPPSPPVPPGAHDMAREYRVLSVLHTAFPLAPRAYLFCDDPAVLGVPFFVMERRQGGIIGQVMPQPYASDPVLCRRISTSLVDALVALHQVDFRALGLETLGRSEGFMARQLAGWYRRWERARPYAVPLMEEIAAWLQAHLPVSPPPTLVHNDFKLDNTMLDAADPGRLVAVFDWDMCTLGDPLADLGQLLCYWVQPGDPPARLAASPMPSIPGFLTRAEVVQRYAVRSGRDVSQIAFYETYGLWKTAIAVAQLYLLYMRGQSRDERLRDYDARMLQFAEAAHHGIREGAAPGEGVPH
jgi:aminoglycoside phosphotransferase (APT) family kinase protein